jgi:putative transcriptional regulator
VSIRGIEPGFLLAAPSLGDSNFEGSVVLLGVHDDDGSLGWTMNGDIIDDAATIVRATGLVGAGDSLPEQFSHPALSGGPVSPETVWILYRRAIGGLLLPGSIPIGDEIAVTATADALKKLIAGDCPEHFRLLVGYAGWGPGQLEDELVSGSWLPSAADPDLLFEGERATLWRRAYAKAIGTVPTAFVSTTRGSA